MSIADFRELGESPDRPNAAPKGNILQAFPPTDLDSHFSNGYRFLLDPCGIVTGYDPNYCEPGLPKMEPGHTGPEVTVPVRMIQAAFSCSPVGYSDEELIEKATEPIERKLWAEVDQVLTILLAAQAVDQTPFPLPAQTVLAQAAGYLATNSQSGTGVIYGPMAWFAQLGIDYTIQWSPSRNAYVDGAGNLVIPHSLNTTVVYAFDSFVDIKTSEIQVLDEFMPGLRQVNDRIVRAEQLYTVATNPCVVGSFDFGSTPSGDTVVVEPGIFPLNVNIISPDPLPVSFTRLDCATDSITICSDEPIEVTFAGGGSITVDGTVDLGATTLAALETITVNQGTSPWTVSGTVALDALTLTALETTTVLQGTSPWVVSVTEPVTVDSVDLDIRNLVFATDKVDASGSEVTVTGEVEVKNDTGNPLIVTTREAVLVPKGYEQLAPAVSTALAVPVGAVYAMLQSRIADVSYRDDGVDPTTLAGMRIVMDNSLFYTGSLAALRFISAGGILDVLYYGVV